MQPLAAGMQGHLPYLAQEYVAAESLDIAMKHYAPASPERVLPFLRGLAAALEAAAAQGIFHGALHPRDVFVTTDEARATGFGIVQAIEAIGFRAPTRRPYTAPERVEGNEWGPPADVFSLGAIAHELLTGRRPAGPADQDGSFAGDVPAEHRARLREVLAHALAEDPAARFASATAFISALDAASEGQHAVMPAPAVRKRAAKATPALSLFDAENAVETVEDVEDTSDVEDTRDVDDTAQVDGADVDSDESLEAEPEAESEGEMETAAEEVEAEADEWPPKGFVTDDLDIVAERETDEALDDFDVELDRNAEVTAPPVLTEPSTFAEPSALDYDTGAEEDEDAYRHGSAGAAAAGAAAAAAGSVAARRPAAWHSSALSEPAAPSASRRPPLLWLIAGVGIGFLIAWMLLGRDTAPTTPANQTAQSPPAAAPAGGQVSEGDLSPSVASPPPAPSTPVADSTPPPAATGAVLVRSTPSNAMVIIDGVWTGRTPLTKRGLSFGTHNIRVRLEGYEAVERRVTLSAANASREMTFALTREPATRAPTPQAPPAGTGPPAPPAGTPAPAASGLSVSSLPAGARVTVDGRFVGITPLNLPDVTPGGHRVTVELEGYLPYTATAIVNQNRVTRVAARLQPR